MKKIFVKASKRLCLVNRFNNLQFLIKLASLLTILGVVVYPFLVILFYSFGINFKECNFSLNAYLSALSDSQTIDAVVNTLYVAISVTGLASLLGGGLAWLTTRTDIMLKKGIRFLVFLTFVIPSYISAVSWIELLGSNGYIYRYLVGKFNLFEIYSLEGIIFVMSIHLFPLVYMALSNTLVNADVCLEDASTMCGANRLQTLFYITIPLIIPSLFSAAILVFSKTLACFGVASLLGLSNGKYLLTTGIYSALSGLDLPLATAISMILVLCSASVFLINSIYLHMKNFTTVTTSSSAPKLLDLGFWRIPLTFIVYCFFAIITIMPLLTIIASSFLKKWGLPLTWENMTLGNYYNIFFLEKLTFRAIKNSLIYGALVSTIVVFLGVIVSYISNRSKSFLAKIMEYLAVWPMAIPGTVLAVAAILAWIRPPFKLYGTYWIIIVTYIAACLPFAVRNVSGLIKNIDINLEKAARVSGANILQILKDVIIPLIGLGMRTGWITSFLFILREIPISVMLYTYGNETIGVLLFNLRSDTGGLETISSVAVIVIVITLLGHLAIKCLKRPVLEVDSIDSSRNKRDD